MTQKKTSKRLEIKTTQPTKTTKGNQIDLFATYANEAQGVTESRLGNKKKKNYNPRDLGV